MQQTNCKQILSEKSLRNVVQIIWVKIVIYKIGSMHQAPINFFSTWYSSVYHNSVSGTWFGTQLFNRPVTFLSSVVVWSPLNITRLSVLPHAVKCSEAQRVTYSIVRLTFCLSGLVLYADGTNQTKSLADNVNNVTRLSNEWVRGQVTGRSILSIKKSTTCLCKKCIPITICV